ncbi:MAG: hypothetical protein ACT4PZ_11390 [Panacagrimonas sp.]
MLSPAIKARATHRTYRRIHRSPKFSGTVGLSRTFDLPGGPLEISAEYNHNSGFFYLAQNSGSATLAAMGRWQLEANGDGAYGQALPELPR